jgi:Immunity protein Imm1
VAHALIVYYDTEHADNPIVVTTPDEVRRLVSKIRKTYLAGSAVLLTVGVRDDPWKSQLSVGIDGDIGVLHYTGEDTPPNGLCSKSPTPTNAAPVIYYYVTSDTEFPSHAEIPVDAVETALIEYLNTDGERPTSVDWQSVALPTEAEFS